jgi:hypothetical protein
MPWTPSWAPVRHGPSSGPSNRLPKGEVTLKRDRAGNLGRAVLVLVGGIPVDRQEVAAATVAAPDVVRFARTRHGWLSSCVSSSARRRRASAGMCLRRAAATSKPGSDTGLDLLSHVPLRVSAGPLRTMEPLRQASRGRWRRVTRLCRLFLVPFAAVAGCPLQVCGSYWSALRLRRPALRGVLCMRPVRAVLSPSPRGAACGERRSRRSLCAVAAPVRYRSAGTTPEADSRK